ncbi:DUF4012 domain-containing protein [Mycolicibacterium sp. S2-37]|uniref:DUF4012 domain-containing protein n=1 Tax=Mycolicibacterium sp. S2-37 TaxID=2810297 RepID=UPI001A94DE96|nr:DUF4012 domain-containing protein [Mycolicibacterium sp. S2-37]MBO0678997.1 DUF4012 domain-containing protein [Mycolicibacterium sp. S2-37]
MDGRERSGDGFRSRRALLATGVLLLAVIAFVAWLGIRALQVKSSLEQARASAQQAKDALLEGDTEGASRAADEVQNHSQAARDAAHSVPWAVASVVPWLGSPFASAQQITDVVSGLATDVLQPTSDVGTSISPDRLYANGRVDIQLLRTEEPQLRAISENAQRLDTEADAISEPQFISAVRDARSQLQEQTAELAGLLENTALAARLMPSMMGADGPRNYFMGFQTNAEARGTGGLVGGFGILRFDDGRPSVDTLAKNTELSKDFAPLDLGPDFERLYGYAKATTDIRNSNLSPHFPYAAQIWRSMWAQQTGMEVDGAIAIDPIALSYILSAVGAITMPDGEVITGQNVVELTESTLYARFPTLGDQVARKDYLQGIAAEVVKKMTGPINSPKQLLDALGKAVGERRIAVWSAVPDEQAQLEETPLAHTVPDDSAPYAQVVINNVAGNKLDYYLKREIEYVADGCEGDNRNSTVTVRLENTAPDSLPPFIAADLGLPRDWKFDIPSGTMVSSVRLYATRGAVLESVLLNGQKTKVFERVEQGHPSFGVEIVLLRGRSAELTFRLSEPTSPGAPRVPVQPLVDNVVPSVSVPECTR